MIAIKIRRSNKTLLKYICCCSIVFQSISASGQQHWFNQYQIDLYKGKPVNIILKSNPTAEMFRTMIRKTYYSDGDMRKWNGPTGLNFAGHYCLAYWGCGSPCQMAAIVDLKNGLVYDGPSGSFGYKFKRNSRLLIVNPDDPHIGCAGCTTKYWVWNDTQKKFIKLD